MSEAVHSALTKDPWCGEKFARIEKSAGEKKAKVTV
jgi:hypothetical protein